MTRSQTHKLGWRVEPIFEMCLHKRDHSLLLQFQQFLNGIGTVSIYKDKVQYVIRSKPDLTLLILHFHNYPLLTQKAADFLLFKEVVNLINRKAHLTNEGLYQIVNIKASINLGLSDLLKSEF